MGGNETVLALDERVNEYSCARFCRDPAATRRLTQRIALLRLPSHKLSRLFRESEFVQFLNLLLALRSACHVAISFRKAFGRNFIPKGCFNKLASSFPVRHAPYAGAQRLRRATCRAAVSKSRLFGLEFERLGADNADSCGQCHCAFSIFDTRHACADEKKLGKCEAVNTDGLRILSSQCHTTKISMSSQIAT
jgi:hypothetical protein